MPAADFPSPRTTTVNNVEVTYYDSENTHDRPDDVLVVVHGTAGTTDTHFLELYPMLAAKRRVVGIDWAQVDPNQRLELGDLTEQVSTAIKNVLPGRKVDLLGYSLGAVVTAAIAAEQPELVQHLILVSGWIRTDLQQTLRNDVWTALRTAEDDQALREYSVFCGYSGDYLGARTMADVQPGMEAMEFTEFGDQQMELNRRIDISEQVKNIAAPTLITSGVDDIMVPPRHQQALAEAIDNSRLVGLSSGHMVVFERPRELSDHIQEFLG